MRFSIRISLQSLAAALLLLATAAAAPPRSADDVFEDVDKVATQIGDLSIPALVDPAARADAKKYLPALRKLIGLAGELSTNPDPGVRAKGPAIVSRYRPALVALDDAATIQEIETQSHSSDPLQAASAKTDLLAGRWIKATTDAQPQLADEAAALARDNPNYGPLAAALYSMTQTGHPAQATAIKLEDALLQMKGKTAQGYVDQIQSIRKLRELVGKPLTIKGMQLGVPGKEFSTDSLKGKVVLIDFWATWCVPCMHSMPHVQELYKTYHEKGLEIVGISCDDELAELNKYLKATPATAWPQLYDGMSPGWNPIATKLGISGIPAMIIIDRKGIVRSVEAEHELDTLVPKLLAEPQ